MSKNKFDQDEQYIIDVKEQKIPIKKIKEHYTDQELLKHIDDKYIVEYVEKKINKKYQ